MPVIAEWVMNWQKVAQAQADAKYSDELKVYEQNRTDWLTNNIHARETGTALTPVPKIPKRKVYSVAPSGLGLTEEDVQDPAISDPVLPPPVPTSKATLTTGANAVQDTILAMLGGCLQMLAELKADMAAMKSDLRGR